MKLQLNKVRLLIIGLASLQVLAVILLVIIRLFLEPDTDGQLLMVNRDVILMVLAIIVCINIIISNRDMKLLRGLTGRLDAQKSDIDNINLLNNTLRAQRHDFLNHVQIIYSLLEMKENKEAMDYMDNLYHEIKQTGKFLKTSHAAINALVSAKMIEAEENDVVFVFDTDTTLAGIDLEVWELCRILSNLIDNAMDATLAYPSKSYIRIKLHEAEEQLTLSVENAGYPIQQHAKIFEAGVTTKQTLAHEHGMGLHIVKELVKKNNGTINVSCENYITQFLIDFPIKRK